MAEKDNMKVNTSPVADVETGTAEDVEAIMKKYDRESNTRIWEGTPKQVIRFLLAAFSVKTFPVCRFRNYPFIPGISDEKGKLKKEFRSDLRYYPYGTRSWCLLLFRI